MSLSRDLMKHRRLTMKPARHGVTDVTLLGRYNYTSAQPALVDHIHLKAIEICFLVKGCQTYRVGGQNYRLTGGDVFITFPNERHSTGGSPEEKGVLYWMVLRVPADGGDFLGLRRSQGETMLKALFAIENRHFRGSWKMKEHLDALTLLYHQRQDPLRAIGMVNKAIAFLLEVLACSQGRVKPSTLHPLAPVLRHIEQHLDEPLSIPELAAKAGLSEARFKVRFKQETGIPPGEYVLRARVDEARRRLERGHSTVTQVAFDLGFSTSQYFATVFRRFTGEKPSSILPHASI
jgi:AraC-like DNA-binding protein